MQLKKVDAIERKICSIVQWHTTTKLWYYYTTRIERKKNIVTSPTKKKFSQYVKITTNRYMFSKKKFSFAVKLAADATDISNVPESKLNVFYEFLWETVNLRNYFRLKLWILLYNLLNSKFLTTKLFFLLKILNQIKSNKNERLFSFTNRFTSNSKKWSLLQLCAVLTVFILNRKQSEFSSL